MATASPVRAASPGVFAVIGIIGIAAVFIGKAQGIGHPFQSYLVGFLMWLVLTLGCLALTILVNLVRGRWGYPILGFLNAGARQIPLMALLFVPILVFLPDIYVWAQPGAAASDATIAHRSSFLNPIAFGIRGAVYFLVWLGIAVLLRKWSEDQDRTGDPVWEKKRASFASAAAVFFVITVTLAVTDWIMSLESHWYSTIFGLLFVAGEALTALAFVVALLAFTSGGDAIRSLVKPKHFHDLGTLLFTLVVFWAYLAFSQFLIIWSGNLPEEITYYAARADGAWRGVGFAVMLLHFALPFMVLLSVRAKRTPRIIGTVAILILVMRVIEMAWCVIPSLHRSGQQVQWLDLAAFIGIGGVWIAAFLWQLSRAPAPPKYAISTMEAEHA